VHNPIKLPPLRTLKVRRPNKTEVNPCMGVMTTVLGCWASAGPARAAQQCSMLEQQLRACMDGQVGFHSAEQRRQLLMDEQKPGKAPKSPINQQLNRLYPQIVGPRKRK
jgi:hypothetical protein